MKKYGYKCKFKYSNLARKFTHFVESKQSIFKCGNYFDNITAFILKSTDGGNGSYKISGSANNISSIFKIKPRAFHLPHAF